MIAFCGSLSSREKKGQVENDFLAIVAVDLMSAQSLQLCEWTTPLRRCGHLGLTEAPDQIFLRDVIFHFFFLFASFGILLAQSTSRL